MTSRILLADDSSYMRSVLRRALREAGFDEFIEVSDGAAAVDAFRREHPDVVLLDIVMPKKSGLDALREIKAIDPGARVVMVTAIGQDVVMDEARSSGADGFVIKPFEATQIADTVHGVLEGDGA